MVRARKAVLPIALAILIGCGGSGTVSNGAHLRFFNALNNAGNVRLYVGGHLYDVGGSTSIDNGDSPQYGDVPSGSSLSLVVNDYGNQSSGGNTSSLATLTGQSLTAGRSYTAVALLVGTAKKLVFFSDNSTLSSDTAYFRIVNANSTTTPLYVQVTEKGASFPLYETPTGGTSSGFASGSYTALQSDYFADSTDSREVTLRVCRDTGFEDEIASTTFSLTPGKAVTAFLYNKSSGSGISFRTSTDRDPNITTPTTTSGETDGTTAGTTATTATAGTTASAGSTAN